MPIATLNTSEGPVRVTTAYCRSCGAEIYWGTTKNQRRCPYDVVDGEVTGTSHFATCKDAKQWSKKHAAKRA
jgi:hypothetical protein